jgi:hypothetical protein
MKYLCLGYLDEAKFSALPEEKQQAVLKECFALCVPFRARGKVVIEEGLINLSHLTSRNATYRPRFPQEAK